MQMSSTMKVISLILSLIAIVMGAWMIKLQSEAPKYERTGHQSLEQQRAYGEVETESYEAWKARQAPSTSEAKEAE